MPLNLVSKTVPSTHDELIDLLLANRGVVSQKEKKEFLKPTFPLTFTAEHVGIDPKQMKKAMALIKSAKEKQTRMLVFGDYDADGVCSTAIMWETLHAYGCKVLPFIPDRKRHGYGLSKAALDEIMANEDMRPELIISVDTGIVAIDAVKRLKADGITVIITDHHQPESTGFPPADAVVHTTQLCGATVSWMVAHTLFPEKAATLLDLCGVATIADMVPLKGPNRSFAKFGLEAMRTTTSPGLRMLFSLAGIDQTNISVQDINFGIAPRINAMARLGDAKEALRLLCSKNPARVRELATKLHVTNTDRQDLTMSMIQTAKSKEKEWEQERIIVLADDTFHDGVVGLVAGKLVEDYWKPAIVIGKRDGAWRASARSIPGVNIVELIRQVREDLVEIGGHPMAAGFSVEESKIETIKKKLQKLALKQITPEMLIKKIDIDCVLPWKLASEKTVQALRVLEPHGMGNPTPVFLFGNLHVVQSTAMGREQEHLKLVLHYADAKPGETIQAVGFRMTSRWNSEREHKKLNIIGNLQINAWRSRKDLQIRITHLE